MICNLPTITQSPNGQESARPTFPTTLDSELDRYDTVKGGSQLDRCAL